VTVWVAALLTSFIDPKDLLTALVLSSIFSLLLGKFRESGVFFKFESILKTMEKVNIYNIGLIIESWDLF
jgi:hypothetical protein